MGRFILTTDNMKPLLFACLVALVIAEPEAKADAEADPWLYYSNHYNYAPSVYSGYRPYQGYNSYPYAYGAYSGLYGGPYGLHLPLHPPHCLQRSPHTLQHLPLCIQLQPLPPQCCALCGHQEGGEERG